MVNSALMPAIANCAPKSQAIHFDIIQFLFSNDWIMRIIYRVFKTWMQIITQTRYLLLCPNFFTLTYIELAKWKLFLTLTILSSKMTKIFKGECLVDPIHKALSNCSLCGQAPRAFHRVILRSARSLKRGAKKEADSASSTILPRDWD